ncbi:MAG: FKBP-type peptidyl-prolyl cis-trans isomerase [Cyclobacteriaceae bacterium]|nr:FKBP-type peptidyl-prolyl cis-trans isomerase [Cyclobacteriaceae bacterium]
MKIQLLSIVLVIFVLTSCKKEREAPNGLKVRVLKEGTGNYAKPGEFLITSMIVKDPKDSIWRDTHEQNLPMIIPVGDESAIPNEKGVESAFRVMKLGDSVAVDIDAKTLFRDQPLPPQLKAEDKMTFVFAVKDITDEAGVNRVQMELQQRQMQEARKQQEGQLGIDTVAIDSWLAAKKINAIKDKSGMRYVVTRMGKGPRPTVASTITFTYKGTLMADGSLFDESSTPVVYPLSQLITGWQICFPMLPKGSAATLYVPSSLGYGPNGYQPGIPPNANLIFEVELIDFTN